MKISEAVEKAMEQGRMIYRKSVWRDSSYHNVLIKPTYSYDTCGIIICRSGREIDSCRNWNPTGDDLMADDWDLWDEFTDRRAAV